MNLDLNEQRPVQCEDNPNGIPGEIVYDDETFPLPNSQHLDASGGPTSENEQGHNLLAEWMILFYLFSSVHPIQSAQHGEEDPAVGLFLWTLTIIHLAVSM